MYNNFFKQFIILLLVAFAIIPTMDAKKKVHTIGDSTMDGSYDPAATYKRGWCMMLQQFLNSDNLQVNNRGKSGASSKSFYKESAYWPTLIKGGSDEMQSGDLLLIQFAHNDEKNGGADGDDVKAYYTAQGDATTASSTDYRGTVANGSYKEYIRSYITEAKAMGVKPIVVGAICRKYFGSDGKIRRNGRHDLGDSYTTCDGKSSLVTGNKVSTTDRTYDYPYQSSLVAAEFDDVPYIDLTSLTASLYESYGDTYCTNNLFGPDDSTHPCALGATLISRTFAQGVKALYESEEYAKEENAARKAVLKELYDNLILSNDISFNPVSGDLGEAYTGKYAKKEFNISAFGLPQDAGDVTITVSDGFELSTDGNNWVTSTTVSYTGATLITSVTVRAKISAAGTMAGTLTVTDGINVKSLDLTATGKSLVQGTETTCEWQMNGNSATATSELLTGKEASYSGMKMISNVATPTSPEGHSGMTMFTTTDGSWPSEIDEQSNRYIQFQVTVPEGKEFYLDNISYDAGAWGGGGMNYHAYYATKSDFSDQVFIDEKKSLTAKTAITTEKDVSATIGEGESLYIRFYPWYGSAATGKYLILSGLKVHGILADAGGVNIEGTITREKVGTADEATYTPESLGACFANVKTEVGSDLLESGTVKWSGTTDDGKIMTNFKSANNVVTGSTPNAGNTVTFTFTPADGFTFVPSKLSLRGAKFGTDGGKWTITASAGATSETLCTNADVTRGSKGNALATLSGDIQSVVATADEPLKIAVSVCSFGTSTNGSKNFGIADLVINGTMSGAAAGGTKYTLNYTVSPEGAGTVTVDPAMDSYKEGKEVAVTATKNFGYKFSHWEENGATLTTDEASTITMDKDRSLTAVFEAVPVYTIKASATNDLEKGGLGSITVTPDEHNGKYEEGEQITVTANESKILKFAGWTDEYMNHAVTSAQRQITVTEDMELVANFEIQDFVAVYDASSTQAYAYENTGTYPFGADVTWDDARNAKCAVVKVSDGSLVYSQSTGTPVVRNRVGVVLSGIDGLYQNGYRTTDIAWQYQFSTKGFSAVTFNGDMAAKNMAHKSYKAQYSLDGTSFTDIADATWDMTANVIKPVSFSLPLECNDVDMVYVRITGTGTDQLSSSYEVEGQFGGLDWYSHSESGVGNVYVLGEAEVADDGTAPVVLSTTPVNNATGISASGTITISYNKRIQKGNVNGNVTLSDGTETKTIEPTFSSKSISFPYANLSYEKTYTVSVPTGYVESKAGKSADAFQLSFTIMNRVKPQARTFNAIVDATLTQLAQKDGVIPATADMPAQYRTIQAAIDAAPADGTTPYIIYVKNGTYRDPNFTFSDSYGTAYTDLTPSSTATETQRIAGGINEYDSCRIVCVNKPNINIIGQSRDGVIISTDRFDGSMSWGSDVNDKSHWDHSRVWYHINAGATIEVQAKGTDFHMENLTVDNENWTKLKLAGPQALCFNISGDRAVLNNVRTRSYQDTYYNGGTYNRTFWNNSEIHGAVDFIYGASDVWFENCVLNINRSTGGYIVAPNHPEGTRWGYVFNNTKITTFEVSDPSTYSISLGRPWHANPKTVFLHTDMELTPVDSLWTETMGGLPALWAVYDFHDAKGYAFTGAKAVSRQYYYYTDIDGSKVWGKSKNFLTDEEAATYTMANVFSGDGTTTANGYWNPTPVVEKTSQPQITVNGNVAEWQKDDYAICYVVQVNGKAVAFPTDCRYVGNEGDVVTVQSVNEYGALSDESEAVTLQSATAVSNVQASGTASASSSIYTIDGKKVSSKNVSGIYIQNGHKFSVK